ncbi:putative virion structural protein [Erwinia phage vB_EamM_Stratton]|uniref:Putative virion structural protein n=1 Tax=Erwinia phage vB_EamM_Stratton TaxID=1883378 RepID=A0A1B2IGZ5_9CAUD|nr:putative virion structural protein [Erwinia phage vB_EamM_Stratton]
MLKASRDQTTFVPVEPETPILNKPQDGVKETTNIVTQPLRTTVTDFDRIPKQYLMKYVEGSAWPVDFFNFLKGKNDAKKFFDTQVITPDQQLEKIIGMELRVTSALDRSQDGQNKTFSLTGSATVANTIAPNEGCFFVAPIGDDRYALFNITSVTRMSNNKVATYNIEYGMLFEVSPAIAETLRQCTVREWYYVAERAWTGGDTLLSPNEYRSFLKLGDAVLDIETTYVKRFWNSETQTLLFPRDWRVYGLKGASYYDVFLCLFVRTIGLRAVGKDIQIYPHPPKNVEDVECLFTAIAKQQPTFLKSYNKPNGAYLVNTFRTMQTRNSVAWSRITNTRYFSDDLRSPKQFPAEWVKFTPFDPTIVDKYRGNEGESLPAFLPLTYNPYLLSETFYNGSYSSLLEYGLNLYLNKRAVSSEIALKLAEVCNTLPEDAQFYYIPLVYVLLKYAR